MMPTPTPNDAPQGAEMPQGGDDSVIIQIPRAQFQQITDGIAQLHQLLSGAAQKADSDLAAPDAAAGEEGGLKGFGDFLNTK